MTEESLTSLVDPRAAPLRHKIGLVALVLLGLAPLWVSVLLPGGSGVLFVRTLTGALFFGMFAMSWDTVSGYTGQISFGHSLFFAVGGYGSALLNLELGLPPLAAIVVGTSFAAAVGLLIGVPALRLEGPYLSLVTLVAPLILLQIFIVESETFGGELGIANPDPIVEVGGFEQETVVFFYVAFVLFVLVLTVLLAVTRSNAGSVFTAIREDEQAVAASGLNPAKFKTFAFVLSAAIGGLAGAVFVHTIGKPSPNQLLVLTVSIEVIIASIVGGMGTIVGAAVGGVFLGLFRSWVSEITATVPVIGVKIGEFDLLIFAVGTLVLLFYLPGGMLRVAIFQGRAFLGDGDQAVPDGGRTPVEQVIASYREAIDRIRGGRRE